MTQQVRVGVAVIIRRMKDGGDVLLIGRRKGSHGAGTWTVPGGHLEYGESVEDCARREVAEETGMKLTSVSKPFAATNDIFKEEDKHYITVWVEATVDERAVPENLEPEKCDGWDWYTGQDIPKPRFLGLENMMAQRPAYFSYM